MANLGEDPELESRLFCEDCRRGAHGKVLSYDGPETRRQLETKELKLSGQCKHCGNQLPRPVVSEPAVAVPRGPGRPRSVPSNA